MPQIIPIVGQIALSKIGSVIGYHFGSQALGFAVGNTLGALIFQPKPKDIVINLDAPKIPKVGDGLMFCLGYGGVPPGKNKGGIKGVPIYIDVGPQGGVTKITTARKVGPRRYGFAGPRQTVYEDKLFLTCFIAYADAIAGPCVANKVRFGDKVIFDRFGTPDTITNKTMFWHHIPLPVTTTTPGTQGYAVTETLATDGSLDVVSEDSDVLHLMRGTWKQPALSFLQNLHTPMPVSGYRGIAGVAVNMYPLDQINNNLPSEIQIVYNNGYTDITEIILFHSSLSGIEADEMDATSLCPINGHVYGCAQTELGPPRVLIEQLARYAQCDLVELEKIIAVSRTAPYYAALSKNEMAAHIGSGQWPTSLSENYDIDSAIPSMFSLGFWDISNDWNENHAQHQWATAIHYNPQSIDFGIAGEMEDFQPRCNIYHNEMIAERFPLELSVLLDHVRNIPGNVYQLPNSPLFFRIQNQGIGDVISTKGRSYDPSIYGNNPQYPNTAGVRPTVDVYGLPYLFISCPIALDETTRGSVIIILAASNQDDEAWAGANITFNDPTVGQVFLPSKAGVGYSQTALGESTVDGFDYGTTLRVKMVSPSGPRPMTAVGVGTPAKEANVRLGANKALLNERVIQWVTVATVDAGAGIYDLSGLLCSPYGLGRFGSDYVNNYEVSSSSSSVDLEPYDPAGSEFLLLVDEENQIREEFEVIELPQSYMGAELAFTIEAGQFHGAVSEELSFICEGNSLRPLSPVDVVLERSAPSSSSSESSSSDINVQDVTLSWAERIRASDLKSTATAPLPIDPQTFNVYLDGASPSPARVVTGETTTFTEAELDLLFGGNAPDVITGSIHQVSVLGIEGFPRFFEG